MAPSILEQEQEYHVGIFKNRILITTNRVVIIVFMIQEQYDDACVDGIPSVGDKQHDQFARCNLLESD